MTAVSLTDVLKPAMDQNRAVAGLVVLGWEDARAYVEAAEATGIPIILQAGPGCRKHTPVPILGKMFRHLADQASVPVVCHIDHGYGFEDCVEGIENGFTSVMFDGSKLAISENIDITAKIAEKAHLAGVSDRESGADAMAISVGNVHLKTDKTTGIDFEALRAVEAVTRLPLVLHGGSGIPVETRRKLARESRVCKFNIGTELRMAFGHALRQSLADNPDSFDRVTLLSPTIEAVKQATIDVISALNGDGT
jgi:fructose-bisphosphate aldolase class II